MNRQAQAAPCAHSFEARQAAILDAARLGAQARAWEFRAVEVRDGWRIEARHGKDREATCIIGTLDEIKAAVGLTA